ncbi:hypothetical protein Dimus_020404, partial [Dionaea muscipula]
YEADPMKFIKEWGIEADVSTNPPCPVKVVHPAPPIAAPEIPSTSIPDVHLQHPLIVPPMSYQKILFPHPNPVSSEKVEKLL